MGASGYESAIVKIRERFLIRLAEQYERSRELARDRPIQKDSMENLEELCAIAHKVAGLAKTVGFPDLGSAAFEADCAIQTWLNDGDAASSEKHVTAAIDRFLKNCEHALA